MHVRIERAYFKGGTNGALFIDDAFFCFTIELPWKENKRTVSCIPEGTYSLATRFSERFQHHLIVQGVPKRNLILVHPANDAKSELEGCIAPVSYLTGIGKGIYSRNAMQKLLAKAHQAKARHEQLLITLTSKL